MNKKQIITEWAGNENNAGSTAAQIGLLTERVKVITEHMLKNKKDFSTKRGLMKIIGHRRRLIKYLERTDAAKAAEVKSKI